MFIIAALIIVIGLLSEPEKLSAPLEVPATMSRPAPAAAPPPRRICADGQTPELDGCVIQGPTATIGIRGAKPN
jgi:hypothetical protein